jgi:hypothetical protein
VDSDQRNEHARNGEEDGLRRQHGGGIGARAAKRAGGGAGRRVAGDAPAVEGELPRPQLLLLQQREAAADAAAHAGAVQPGSQAGDEERERQGHMTFE